MMKNIVNTSAEPAKAFQLHREMREVSLFGGPFDCLGDRSILW